MVLNYEIREKVVRYLFKTPIASAEKIREYLHISKSRLSYYLRKALDEGIVRKDESGYYIGRVGFKYMHDMRLMKHETH